jgi:hypothetical protein
MADLLALEVKLRHLMSVDPRAEDSTASDDYGAVRNGKRADVRFGSKADMTL